ncbi:receptor-type tyrosine-protein phosphatase gamma, partial [Caerostris darwini]
ASKRNNPVLDPIITSLPKVGVPGKEVAIQPFPLHNLLPKDVLHYYRYMGSLTTPPCTENVVWTIMAQPLLIGELQLKALRRVRQSTGSSRRMSNNVRPTQDLNDRIVLESIPKKKKRGHKVNANQTYF